MTPSALLKHAKLPSSSLHFQQALTALHSSQSRGHLCECKQVTMLGEPLALSAMSHVISEQFITRCTGIVIIQWALHSMLLLQSCTYACLSERNRCTHLLVCLSLWGDCLFVASDNICRSKNHGLSFCSVSYGESATRLLSPM